ncbi:hypothetical protein C8Q79DRAFT_1012941 [Trametes meyenii]|nr:hypothetical protein C8Q79DRAFT_1012941 [Trametes meyenii]
MSTRILAIVPCNNVTTIVVLHTDCEPERSPSITGAAIAGSIILGVIFLLLLGGLFYAGYYRELRNQSAAFLGSDHATPSINLWSGPHQRWLRPANARLMSLFPVARSRWDAAVQSVRIARPDRAFFSGFAPPPPYDPECVLPPYDAAIEVHAAANSSGAGSSNAAQGLGSSTVSTSSLVTPPARSGS